MTAEYFKPIIRFMSCSPIFGGGEVSGGGIISSS